MELDDEAGELVVVSWLVLVELDDPLLEDVEEGVDAVVVGLLLETSRKARVNRHLYDIQTTTQQPTPCDSIPHAHQFSRPLSSSKDPSVLPSYSHAESASQNTSMSSLNLSSYCSSESSIMPRLSRYALSSFFSSQTCYPLANKSQAFSWRQPSFLPARGLSLPRWCLSRCVTILWEVLNSACSFLCCRQISLGVLPMSVLRCSRKDSQRSRPFIRYLSSSFAQAQRSQRVQPSQFLPCCLPLLAFLAVKFAPGSPWPIGMPCESQGSKAARASEEGELAEWLIVNAIIKQDRLHYAQIAASWQ